MLLDAAAGPTAALEAAMLRPRQVQLDLLRAILAANADCEFGRAHGFGRLRSIEDYRASVPVRAYSDFAPAIERMAQGERAVLTAEAVIAFEETGGSASGRKLIPYTKQSLTAFRNAALPWLADLARRRPGAREGKVYAAISPATRQPQWTAGGLKIGLESEAAYLGADLIPAILSMQAVSPEVGGISDVEEWRIETLAQLIACPELSFISVWSPTFLLDLIGSLPRLADRIAPRLADEARDRLHDALASETTDTVRLWPQLDCISCWTDGASAHFAEKLCRRFSHAAIEPKALLATEAPITLRFGEEPGGIPALTSTFVEYNDDKGRARLCDELEKGESYRIAITSWGGLYRYDIGDMVKCIGHEGAVPRLRFEGRAGLTSDLVGEKLDDAFVAEALAGLDGPALLVPRCTPHSHYELWVENEYELDAAAATVDAALGANPQYAFARRIGQLAPVSAVHRPGFMSEIVAKRVAAGSRLGDAKPVSLLCGEER